MSLSLCFCLIFIYSVYVTGTMHINQHLSFHVTVNVSDPLSPLSPIPPPPNSPPSLSPLAVVSPLLPSQCSSLSVTPISKSAQ